eukprot:GFYU01008921.1.p1 GENE.GFYU01008921.1~~GFYU01008921.1.p1  ORF type:complete len:373 (+),score=113.26 GFYU01008921.1:131-1249(+)
MTKFVLVVVALVAVALVATEAKVQRKPQSDKDEGPKIKPLLKKEDSKSDAPPRKITNAELALLEASLEDPLISLNETGWKQMSKQPRYFDAFVLFTVAKDPSYPCKMCHMVAHELRQVASNYQQFYPHDMLPNHAVPIYFMTADYSDHEDLFHDHMDQLRQIPVLVHVPFIETKKPKVPVFAPQLVYDIAKNGHKAKDISQFVLDATNIMIPVRETKEDKRQQQAAKAEAEEVKKSASDPFMALVTLTVVLLSWLFWDSREYWMVASMTVYFMCIGGVTYNRVMEADYFYFHPYYNQVMFFHPGPRSQFIIEGMACSGLSLIMFLCMSLQTWKVPYMHEDRTQQVFTFAVLFALFWLCFFQLKSLQKAKMGF